MKTDEGMDEEASTEEGEVDSKEGIKVPEEFQVKCHELLKDCDDEACLDYLSSSVSKKRSEMYKNENPEPSAPVKGKKVKTPSKFSVADMPS